MALDYVIRYAGRRIHGVQPGDSIAGGTCEMEAGSIGTLTFELPPTHPMARPGAFAVEDATREVTLSDGETEIFRGWVKKTTLSSDLVLTVECESMLAYLKRTVVRPYSCRPSTDLPDGATLLDQDVFEWMVAQHNLHAGEAMAFEVGVNPHVGEVRASTDYKSTWDEMNDALCTGLDRYLNARSGPGGERYLDLLDGGIGEGTQVVVLGENVVDLEVAGESGEVVTAIIARGTSDDTAAQVDGDRIDRRGFGLEEVRDGEVPLDNSLLLIDGDRAINQRLVDAYGIREEKRDYEASDSAELLRMVSADLNPSNVPEGGLVNSVVVQAVDLHAVNPLVQPISLLEWDRVFVRAYGLEDEDAEYGVSTGGRLVIDQWLPCSQIHIDLADPSQSTYRFGDLPQTLTRQSALRMGMLRRGNGELVRRTDATPWNNDRVWNRTDDVWDHADEVGDELREELQQTTDQWAEHLDEQFDTYTQQWYLSLDEAQRENAQGREELLKHIDEVEGKWDDAIGRIDGDLSDLESTVDSNHRTLLDGIREVAEASHRTYFGVCGNTGSSRTVSSTELTRPGGEDFALEKGVVVEVLMTYAWAGACTLNIAGTGARSVRTNGAPWGVWQDGQVVRFLWDGSYWQACSTDIYGDSITVGNPSGANFHTDGKVAEMLIDDDSYWHVGVDGERIGLLSQSHVDVKSTYVDIVNPGGGYLRIERSNDANSARIMSPQGVYIDNGATDAAESELMLAASGQVSLGGPHLYFGKRIGSSYSTMEFFAGSFTLNNSPVVMRSIVAYVSNASYVNVSTSALGISSANGYSWSVSNGDAGAVNAAALSASYNPSTRGITVLLSGAVSGNIRLNIVGVPVSTLYMQNEPGLPEGPEVFDAAMPFEEV